MFGVTDHSGVDDRELNARASEVMEVPEDESSGSGEMMVGVNDDMSSVQSFVH